MSRATAKDKSTVYILMVWKKMSLEDKHRWPAVPATKPEGILYRHSLTLNYHLPKVCHHLLCLFFFLISSLLGLTDIIVKK